MKKTLNKMLQCVFLYLINTVSLFVLKLHTFFVDPTALDYAHWTHVRCEPIKNIKTDDLP